MGILGLKKLEELDIKLRAVHDIRSKLRGWLAPCAVAYEGGTELRNAVGDRVEVFIETQRLSDFVLKDLYRKVELLKIEKLIRRMT